MLQSTTLKASLHIKAKLTTTKTNVQPLLLTLLMSSFLATPNAYANIQIETLSTTQSSLSPQSPSETSHNQPLAITNNNSHTLPQTLLTTTATPFPKVFNPAATTLPDRTPKPFEPMSKKSDATASDAHMRSQPSQSEINSEPKPKPYVPRANQTQPNQPKNSQADNNNNTNNHRPTEKPVVTYPPIVIPAPPPVDMQKELLKAARQSSKHTGAETSSPNPEANIPAFRRLMDTGVRQLKSNQLNQAEASFTQAQRMIPQSSAVYFYLGQVALKKQQHRKAEAFARRGLVVSDSDSRKRALWQIILKSAKLSGDKKTIAEARQALR